MNKLLCIVLFSFSTFFLSINNYLANPAPLGLELGKATLKEIEKNYKIIESQSLLGGKAISIQLNSIDFEKIQQVIFYVDKDGVLQGTLIQMNKSEFDETFDSLQKKYTLVSKEIPFVGNKKAFLKMDDVIIYLEAPHLSFEMNLIYRTNSFHEALRKMQADDQKRLEEKRKDLL